MNVLNTGRVLEILNSSPEAEFSLQPVKVKVENTDIVIKAGYHIFEGHLPRMIHVTGGEIWSYVPKPTSPAG